MSHPHIQDPAAFAAHYGDKTMPIAIVGVAGRFPGDASNPDKLWELLSNGRSALSEIPKDRFNIDAFYHPHAERAGSQNFRGAHFMNRAPEAFDAPFFSITPNEAKAMDPQQRMCLEVAYEALENAGIPMESVVGSDASCYVGCFTQDYNNMMSHDSENLPAYFPTGVAPSCLSNRVSWFYDLHGPSMTVDTACSSSLVALHLACQSIRAGEANMSLVGGVNFMCTPEYNTTMSTLHFLTPDSKCQSFDKKGNGYARGEGASFIVLKPLNIAIKDNDIIRGVIRNTGSNQDGNTPGITLPSSEAQASLIRKVYKEAGLDLADTGYFEAHGTGTAAGDPIETSALGATIGKARPSDKPLWVGSIKANIGHLEGASGLAGLTKAVYVLEKGLIPPQVWLEEINPRIKTEEWNLAIPREPTPWPYKGLRRVSINSFGFGGANAHAVIDDAYHYMKTRGINGHHNTEILDIDEPISDEASDSGVSISPPETVSSTSDDYSLVYGKLSNSAPKLIVWSAHEQNGVQRISEAYTNYLKSKVENLSSTEEQVLVDRFSYTTAERRSILPWKSFAIGSSVTEIIDSLNSVPKPIRSSRVPKLAFVFTGQGAQHFAMGRELLGYEVYADSVRDASVYLTSIGCTWSAEAELLKDEAASQINDPAYSQPLCTVVQVALVDLLRRWGITPAAVVGHSSGKIAAAYAKGAITREDAWAIAYHRGRLSALLPSLSSAKGGMLAAGVGEEDAQSYVAKASKGKAVVACMNSPSSVTISGDVAAILEIEEMLKADGVFARQLKLETAYHSPHMNAISELYLQSIQNIKTLAEDTNGPKMFSSVTGELIESSSLGPSYWVSNMLSPVKFSAAAKELIEHSDNRRKKRASAKPYVDILVEIGPHGALQGPIKQILGAAKAECTTFSILSRGQDAAHMALQGVGRLFQHGYPINIAAANIQRKSAASNRSVLPDLPPFPWNHTNKYWHESAVSYNYRFKKVPRKDLLGMLDNEGNSSEIRWRNFFRLSENPWIEDHSVHNTLLYPAAGMMVMAIEAAAQIADPAHPVDGYELRDVVVGNALIVPRDEDGVETMFHLRPWRTGTQSIDSSWYEFVIYSRPGKEAWSHNCTGLLRVRYKTELENPVFRNEVALAKCFHRERHQQALLESKTPETPKSFYDHQFEIGLQLGDTFRNLIEINKGDNQSACAIQIPDMASTMPKNFIHDHVIHPCTLDAIVQTLLPTVEGTVEKMKVAAIPTYIERLFVSSDLSSKPGDVLRTYSVAGYTGLKEAEASVYASTENWEKPLVVLERIRATRLSALTDMATLSESKANLRKIAGEFRWKEDILNVNNAEIQTLCQNSPLLTLTGLAAHKNPAMRILEIGAKDGETTQKLLAALAANDGETTPWYKSYIATDCEESALSKLKDKLSAYSPYVDCKVLDIGQDLLSQGFQEADYDYIIISELSAQSADDAIANIRKLIKTGGKLVVSGSATPALTSESWAEKLQANDFTGVDCLWPTAADEASSPFGLLLSSVTPRKTLPGDILLIESNSPSSEASELAVQLTSSLQSSGVAVSSVRFDAVGGMDMKGKFCIMLAELERSLLFDLAADDFQTVKNIILNSAGLVWVTRGAAINCEDPSLALITGLSRTIRQEHPDVSFATLDLDIAVPIDILENADYILKTINEVTEDKGDREFAVRNGRMMIPRVHLDKGTNALLNSLSTERPAELAPFKQPGRALTLSIGVPGMLDTLFFKDHDIYVQPLKDGEVEIEVKASGLNFMDIMVAMDQIQEPAVGLECSGIVSRVGSSVTKFKPGDRAMTWLLGGFSTFARNAESMFQPIPADMSFEIAASLPMIYCTAYQALVETARLQPIEKVLIHAAAGGVGQAAVMIAKHIGAEIFATVGSQAKKDILIHNYGIPEDHIFNSRDLSFADGVMRLTGGKGVDVVLNSLAGEGLRKSWLCLAWFGRFVELGKKDITENSGLDMTVFMKNVSFQSVNVIGTLRESVPRASRMFERTMAYFHAANCQPVSPVNVMSYSQIEEGFRLVQSGKHIGKVVFNVNDDDRVMALPRPVKQAKFDANVTYVLSGGLGGLGRSLSQWMVEHGARNLVFLSRSGSAKPEARALLDKLATEGVKAIAYACDIGNATQVEEAIESCKKEMPPIRGVIQAAMALADAAFDQMTPEQWSQSVNPKAAGTWNLHRFLPRDMDFFVMLSSSSGVAGNRGQSNYAAGNTFLDALAHHRRAQGLPAVAFDVGPVTGIGYVAENSELIQSLESQGYIALKAEEFMAVLQASITGETLDEHTVPIQVITGFSTGGLVAANGWTQPYYLDDAKMSHIVQVDTAGVASEDAGKGWQDQLGQVASVSAGADLVAAALGSKLAKQMMVAAEDIDLSKPVSTYGVDSLTAVEIRAWSFRDLQANISIFDIMSNVPISGLARTIVTKSKFVPKQVIEADN